jgi:mono/diheme cytochrome c family protein
MGDGQNTHAELPSSRLRPDARGRYHQDMTSRIVRRSIGALALVGATITGTGLETQAGPALYTQAQAARGQQAYTASCASCHGAELRGVNDAPPLAGDAFLMAWGGQRVSDLVAFVQQSMPPSGPGSLPPDTTLDLVAYVLKSIGARSGEQPLTASTGARIETVAGQVPVDGAGKP